MLISFSCFIVLQVRCSRSVHAFSRNWLVTDRGCSFIFRNQGLFILSMCSDVFRLLQCEIFWSVVKSHTSIFWSMEIVTCPLPCLEHLSSNFYLFIFCGVYFMEFSLIYSTFHRKMATSYFFSVLVQFLRHISPDNSYSTLSRWYISLKWILYMSTMDKTRRQKESSLHYPICFVIMQDGKVLPDGPVVISPDGLFPSLYREGNQSAYYIFWSYSYVIH